MTRKGLETMYVVEDHYYDTCGLAICEGEMYCFQSGLAIRLQDFGSYILDPGFTCSLMSIFDLTHCNFVRNLSDDRLMTD